MTRLFSGTPFDRPPRCDKCKELLDECICPPEVTPLPAQTPIKIFTEMRKKKKCVTVIKGVVLHQPAYKKLLTELKNLCGAGGKLEDTVLTIQGDHVGVISEFMRERGYKIQPRK